MKKNIASIRQNIVRIQQNKRRLVLGVCGLSVLVVVTLLLLGDVRFLLQSRTALKAYEQGDTATAQSIYASLEEHSRLGYLATQNSAVLAYMQEEYQTALTLMAPVVQEVCFVAAASATSSAYTLTLKDVPPRYCDLLTYNFGNMLYRAGEVVASSSTASTSTTPTSIIPEITKTLWYQAIGAYQSDLALEPDDTDAQDNIDFILKQLQEEQDATFSEEEKESASGAQKDDTQSDDEQNGEQGDEGEQTEQGQPDAGAREGDAQEGEGGQTDGEEGQSHTATPNDNQQLSENASKQVDRYMQELEQQSQQMQQYFRQNPQAAPAPQQSNSMFDDPFFNQFFGTPNTPLRGEEGTGSLEKDW